MCPWMQTSFTYVRDLYAITKAIKKWRQYLLGHTFRVFTDHKSLKELVTQTIRTPEQQKWLTKLLGYSFEIHYKPGRENVVADALFCAPEAILEFLAAVSSPTAAIFELLHNFSASSAGHDLLQKFPSNEKMQNFYTKRGGLLYHNGRLFIPLASGLTQSLLIKFHSSVMGGHSGVKATCLAVCLLLLAWHVGPRGISRNQLVTIEPNCYLVFNINRCMVSLVYVNKIAISWKRQTLVVPHGQVSPDVSNLEGSDSRKRTGYSQEALWKRA
ncbi:UNVERIFIED_CONTAM: Transposon Tf2-11 polyprotein [Sesamum latifolium]|uniref:Transposon Tf2-11 polyprotein n=1 Tax=Sesamum latifolium TaxID=2727402 RepID=A0AAW2VY05_9LAMI